MRVKLMYLIALNPTQKKIHALYCGKCKQKANMFDLTVTVKGEESTYKHKFPVYEECVFSQDDEVIKEYIAKALAMSKIQPEKIKIRASFEVL